MPFVQRLTLYRYLSEYSSIQAVVFVSKDENLAKAHMRYLEGRLIQMAKNVGKVKLFNTQSSGSKLPESDRADMEVFLDPVQIILLIVFKASVSFLALTTQ